MSRYMRACMLEVLRQDYILTARAKGLAQHTVILRHALRNALLPVITVSGIQFGYMLGGTIIVEQVFSLPGLGRLLLSAIYQRDFPVIQGGVIFITIVFCLMNFLVDILYVWVNPKMRGA
jgi:ABC-type dipeptide/oligopeptide/nickel transport system permease component